MTEGMPSSNGKGSGVHIENNSQVQISNCVIDSNLVDCYGFYNRGGAVYVEGNEAVTSMKNCIIANNEISTYPGHSDGGGIYIENEGNLTVENCTITNTIVDAPGVVNGAGIFVKWPEQLIIKNTILFKNGDKSLYYDFGFWDSSRVNITYSCIDYGYPGQGNISSNPLFLDNQFHLVDGFSPCIDSGDPNFIYNDIESPDTPGFAKYPALGTTRNDIGAYGGPLSSSWPLIVETPVFNPSQGTFFESQSVTIGCNTPLANIHYTMNGSDPVESDSIYTNPIYISSTTTLKARAFKAGWSPSDVAIGTYIITGTVDLPTFSPSQGTYTESQNITIHCTTMEADIHYTTNGSDPGNSDPIYTNPIHVSSTTTLKARAFKTGWNPSNVASGTYIITGTSVSCADFNCPLKFCLNQNYPNPFNPTTNIEYQLPENCFVNIGVFSVNGREIITLVNEKQEAGSRKIQWNGLDEYGIHVPSGIYIYQIKADQYLKSMKMILNR